jgi:hypothetical protein
VERGGRPDTMSLYQHDMRAQPRLPGREDARGVEREERARCEGAARMWMDEAEAAWWNLFEVADRTSRWRSVRRAEAPSTVDMNVMQSEVRHCTSPTATRCARPRQALAVASVASRLPLLLPPPRLTPHPSPRLASPSLILAASFHHVTYSSSFGRHSL